MNRRPKYLNAGTFVTMPPHVCREVADMLVVWRRTRFQQGAQPTADTCEWVDSVVAAARLHQDRLQPVSACGSECGSARGGSAEISEQCAYDLVTADVAHLADLGDRRIRQLAEAGDLPGRKVGGVWQFDAVQVHRWLEDRDQ